MAFIDEEILAKTGPELFRELLRVYPIADVEDYLKAGQWKNDVMKCDLQLVNMHRREAGAPDPIPLEDVRMPEMPEAAPMPQQMPAGVRPMVAGAAVRAPIIPKAGGSVMPAPAGPAGATNAATELRLIALFIAKWKLDPTQVKIMLAKLLPARRRYVIQHFKATTQGPEATNALQQFINRCEQTNAWAGAVAPAPAGAAGIRLVAPMTGMKRPMAPMMAAAGAIPAKRPHLMSAVTPPRPPAAKPAGVQAFMPVQPGGGLRPGGQAMLRPQRPVAPKGGLIRGLLQRV